MLEVQHSSIGELLVTLAAPSGAQANLVIPQSESGSRYSFIAAAAAPLAALADEDREGNWRLTIVDQRADDAARCSVGDCASLTRSRRATLPTAASRSRTRCAPQT